MRIQRNFSTADIISYNCRISSFFIFLKRKSRLLRACFCGLKKIILGYKETCENQSLINNKQRKTLG